MPHTPNDRTRSGWQDRCLTCHVRTLPSVATCDTAGCMLLDAMPTGLLAVDIEGRITLFNREAERITGVDRLSAMGGAWWDALRRSEGHDAAVRETLETGRRVMGRVVVLTDREGRAVRASVSTMPLRDDEDRLVGCLESIRELPTPEPIDAVAAPAALEGIVGHSPALRDVIERLPALADSQSTVLIEGASGTGKELVARAIHRLSPRRDKPFVAVNCGALPDTLLESELFGYKRGAFTDARQDKPGRFTVAEGGTILLDEIADISPAMQMRLLRVLQERVYEPLGSVKPVRTTARVLAATNRDLRGCVRAGTFREDLLYRIDVVRITLPTLRERREDLPALIEHILHRLNRRLGHHIEGVDEHARAVLLTHDYPGNIRELENILEHAMVYRREGRILVDDLPAHLRGGSAQSVTRHAAGTLAHIEQAAIREALMRHRGNRRAAARELGVHPSTLYRRVGGLSAGMLDR